MWPTQSTEHMIYLFKVVKLLKSLVDELDEWVTCRWYVTSFLNFSKVSNKEAFVLTFIMEVAIVVCIGRSDDFRQD